MYIGNGTTKKFPIPIGYDGSVVVLRLPSGKSIKMTEGEGYEIRQGSVVFNAAVPSGVVVSFDEPEATETLGNANSYVIIYGDGSMREVTEDPAIYLETVQKLLTEAREQMQEVREYASATITRLLELRQEVVNEFDGKLYDYGNRAEDAITDAVSHVRQNIRNEWNATLDEISGETVKIRDGLHAMEEMRREVRDIVSLSAERIKEELSEQCADVLVGLTEMRELRADVQGIYKDAKYAAETAGREAQAQLNVKVNEELEVLRSLRLRLEEDYEMLNTKITNRLELLRSE